MLHPILRNITIDVTACMNHRGQRENMMQACTVVPCSSLHSGHSWIVRSHGAPHPSHLVLPHNNVSYRICCVPLRGNHDIHCTPFNPRTHRLLATHFFTGVGITPVDTCMSASVGHGGRGRGRRAAIFCQLIHYVIGTYVVDLLEKVVTLHLLVARNLLDVYKR